MHANAFPASRLLLLAVTTLVSSKAALASGGPALWGLEMVGRNYALEKGYSGAGVKVGVMDEAARNTHQEFADRWMGGFNVDGSPYGPIAPHGTHVAGTIAGEHVGVAPGSLLYGINWSALNGDTGYANGYRWGLAQGIRLFSNSWGLEIIDPVTGIKRSITVNDISRTQLESGVPQTLSSLVDSAAAGSVQVFATGNDAMIQPGILASLPYYYAELQPHWIAVTAVGPTGVLASYANMCGVAAAWCIAAPGGDGPGDDGIWSAGPNSDDYYVSMNGTSMATPHVTGAMAITAQMFPDAAYSQLGQLVLQTATDIGEQGIDPVYGWGLLNLRNIVDTVEPATGDIFAGAAWSRFTAMDRVTQVMRSRLQAPIAYDSNATSTIASSDAGRTPAGPSAWLTPVYGTASLAASASSSAYNSETAGLVGGIDLIADTELQLGIAGGFTHARLTTTGKDNSATATNVHLGAYGRWAAGGWFADGTAQFAHFDQSIIRRSISGATDTSIAPSGRSNVTGLGTEVGLRAGHRFELEDLGSLSPYASITTRWQHANATNETGAGIFSLTVPSAEYAQIEAGPGLRIESTPIALTHHTLRLAGDISYTRLAGDRNLHVPVELLGRTLDARTGALGADVLRLVADVNLTSASSTGVNWFAAYDGAFQKRASLHTVTLGARMRF